MSLPYYNGTANCTIGAELPTNGSDSWKPPRDYISTDGNDTAFHPFAACCTTQVGFEPPCTLWCETDPTGGETPESISKCWEEYGFRPYAWGGVVSQRAPQRATMPVIIGAVLGSIAFIASVVGLWLWWGGKRSSGGKHSSSQGSKEENLAQYNAVDAPNGPAPPAYESVKYRLQPTQVEQDTKYDIKFDPKHARAPVRRGED